jgi:hypothetical protein
LCCVVLCRPMPCSCPGAPQTYSNVLSVTSKITSNTLQVNGLSTTNTALVTGGMTVQTGSVLVKGGGTVVVNE